jgi:hypothetical protein
MRIVMQKQTGGMTMSRKRQSIKQWKKGKSLCILLMVMVLAGAGGLLTGCEGADSRATLGEAWHITTDDITEMTLTSTKAQGSVEFDSCEARKLERYGKEILNLKLGKQVDPVEDAGVYRFLAAFHYQTADDGECIMVVTQYDDCISVERTRTDEISCGTSADGTSAESTAKVYYYEDNIDIQDTFSRMTEMVDVTNKDTAFTACPNNLNEKMAKPVIYLYPQETTDIQVLLENITLTCTYPEYKNGWSVTAKPDGTILQTEEKKKAAVGKKAREYYCLYYEGEAELPADFTTGFVIEREDYQSFLEEKLALLGLNDREAQEFIVYWLPIMQKHERLLVHFLQTDELQQCVPLKVAPEPDSMIRVFMQFTTADKGRKVTEQKLEKTVRSGYSVVEWGGSDLTEKIPMSE